MQQGQVFEDRDDAGRALAARLTRYAGRPEVLVLALPRGGVPVAYRVARALDAPLDVMVVRKLGLPGQPELAMGAIASGGVRVLNEEVLELTGVPPEVVEHVTAEERRELERRERAYRGDRPPPDVAGRTVILVDDGVATGSTLRAAVEALRTRGPARIVVAVPTAPPGACEMLAHAADEAVCVTTPEPFFAISLSYRNFPQLTDEEVRGILDRAADRRPPQRSGEGDAGARPSTRRRGRGAGGPRAEGAS
ncbi:MAG TPA: phosphoribosyltransferase [Longimicrobiales bacterium]